MISCLNSYSFRSIVAIFILLVIIVQWPISEGRTPRSDCDLHTQVVWNFSQPITVYKQVSDCLPDATATMKKTLSSIISVEMANRTPLERAIEKQYANWLCYVGDNKKLAKVSLGIGQINFEHIKTENDQVDTLYKYIDKISEDDCFNLSQVYRHVQILIKNMSASSSIDKMDFQTLYNQYHGLRGELATEESTYSCVATKIYDQLSK